MASIGGISGFTGWRGGLHPATRRIAKLAPRAGATGDAFVYDGWASTPDIVITRMAVADQAAADSIIATARGLMDGASHAVTDPQDRAWSVRVLHVVPDQARRGQGGVLLTLTWTLQVEAAAP